jgi:hypothetical protein
MVVGVINTDKNFPAVYSFAKSKARASFNFIFKCLKRFIFIDNIAKLYIMLANQAAGLIALMLKVMSNYKL